MKKTILAAMALLSGAFVASAQQPAQAAPELQFTTVKELPITSVKNQASSGTCWAFSTISFLESEAIRINNIKDPAKYPDFSVFFVVSHSYADRADKYVRLDGNLTFGAGSEADDVLHVVRDYGLVPLKEMTGMNYGTALPAQSELDAVLKAYVQAVAKVPNRTLTTAWKNGFQGILDAYLGTYPETFTVDGKQYTPASYRDAMKINPDDYVTLTSFTHHPFYTKFAIEVCDNWRWDEAYNVPIEEFMQVLDYAIDHGYTAAWGTDVSEAGFNRQGLGLLLETAANPAPGSDQERWVGRATSSQPVPDNLKEINPTQEYRQIEFDTSMVSPRTSMAASSISSRTPGVSPAPTRASGTLPRHSWPARASTSSSTRTLSLPPSRLNSASSNGSAQGYTQYHHLLEPRLRGLGGDVHFQRPSRYRFLHDAGGGRLRFPGRLGRTCARCLFRHRQGTGFTV